MSGRQAGYCSGYDAPGYANPAPRLGLARGCRGGRRGQRHMYYATGLPRWARGEAVTPAPQQQLDALKHQAEWLQDQLEAVVQRIGEIEVK